MSDNRQEDENRFFGALPTRGIWTALGLPRNHFLAIVIASLLAFVFIGGPVWLDPRGQHFWRIVLSYLLIPLLVGASQVRTFRGFALSKLFAATIVIGAIKLVLTALLALVLS